MIISKFAWPTFMVSLMLLSTACSGTKNGSDTSEQGDTIRFEYADNIKAIRYKDYTLVKIRNPWDTLRTLHSYILTDKESKTTEPLPAGTIVRTPISRALIYSSVHCALFMDLNCENSIAGVCDSRYIHLPFIEQGCKEGSITDCGSSMSPNIETVINTRPDAILLSPFENSGGYGKIEKLDVPIIECADYMESSPLGRAEWMKFYGMLTGKEKIASAMFDSIRNQYERLSQKALLQTERPTVISELKSGAAWYVPTGRSTTGRLIHDAGGQYIFAHLPEFGAVPLSVETVMDKGMEADIWIVKYGHVKNRTLQDLAKEYQPYCRFKAFTQEQVYGCNTFNKPFYEESPFHPDVLLRDFIKIFHPELMDGYKLRYFERLKAQ